MLSAMGQFVNKEFLFLYQGGKEKENNFIEKSKEFPSRIYVRMLCAMGQFVHKQILFSAPREEKKKKGKKIPLEFMS